MRIHVLSLKQEVEKQQPLHPVDALERETWRKNEEKYEFHIQV